LIFLVGAETDSKATTFLRKNKAVMVWRPVEWHVLVQSMESVMLKTTTLVSLADCKGLSLRAA
jgi:hypothetical protein